MFHIFVILLLLYNGNKVDGNFELRSKQQLKHCLKHSQIGPSRWRIDKQLKGYSIVDRNSLYVLYQIISSY